LKKENKTRKTIKLRAVNVSVFLIGFVLLFGGFQSQIRNKWNAGSDLRPVYADYEQQPTGSIDVLFMGTSEIHEGVSPMTMYHENGITSYNLATSWRHPITTYYQLEYALKHQTPKLVVCDFAALFEPDLYDALGYKISDTMPDPLVRLKLIHAICEYDKSVDPIDYFLPMVRVHDMWSTMTAADLGEPEDNKKYPPQFRGGMIFMREYDGDDDFEITPELWTPDDSDDTIPQANADYYDKMINLCRSKGITIVMLNMPRVEDAPNKAATWAAMENFFTSRGVKIYDYNTYEAVQALGLDLHTHYRDETHLNWRGAFLFSEHFAQVLKADYSLPDRRGQYADWDKTYSDFAAYYGIGG